MRYNHFQCRLNKTASMMLPLLLKTHIHLKGEISSQYCFQLLTESGGMRRVCFYIDHSLQNFTSIVSKSISKDPPVPTLEQDCCPDWRYKLCSNSSAWLLLLVNTIQIVLITCCLNIKKITEMHLLSVTRYYYMSEWIVIKGALMIKVS